MDVEVQEEADQRQPLYLRLTLDVTRDECFVRDNTNSSDSHVKSQYLHPTPLITFYQRARHRVPQPDRLVGSSRETVLVGMVVADGVYRACMALEAVKQRDEENLEVGK
jgi:hypothetical protein